MKIFRLILYLPLLLVCCCNDSKSETTISEYESQLIISKSLEYILEHKMLPKDYYDKPILIANTDNRLHLTSKIHVNGFDCIILPQTTNISKIIKRSDIYKPVPLLEIISINMKGKYFYTDLIFRSTGHTFLLVIEKKGMNNFKVKTLKQQSI
ncbi:hypothetical protein [Pedobacter mucosus]|uniref:hypothetical protein n=1 Tax=Pedobacter mucosus TaxID=2895286 RepID=UPI001EE455AA|nr:hypothetical protein [Pedobacter mucosus]UKT63404.1 hypothetical protein LOK61_16740 [Pedobacter mucosus]